MSTPLLLAASISTTSRMEPSSSPRQISQAPHGSPSCKSRQLTAFDKIFAQVVFPVPREPVNRYAWAICPERSSFFRVSVTCGCPTTSANTLGRHLRYNTWYISPPLFILFLIDKRKTRQAPPGRFVQRDIRTDGLPASHGTHRLMLLGSPPDMVHGAPPCRPIRPHILRHALLSCFMRLLCAALFIIYDFEKDCNCFWKKDKKRACPIGAAHFCHLKCYYRMISPSTVPGSAAALLSSVSTCIASA